VSVYDDLEAAGHELTFLSLSIGVSSYYCENCGAYVQVGGSPPEVSLFHMPRYALWRGSSAGTRERCCNDPPKTGEVTLKQKLKALEDESMDRLRRL
jgi:hypothetical protein